jgi:hypothetical protein
MNSKPIAVGLVFGIIFYVALKEEEKRKVK